MPLEIIVPMKLAQLSHLFVECRSNEIGWFDSRNQIDEI